MPAELLDLSYRHSAIGASQVVVRGRARPAAGDAARAEAEIADIVRWRREHQPGGQNAGSVFTNPPGDSAGRLIDAAGAKGLRIGTAEVSTKHANFIQADEGGRADDVLALMIEVQRRVLDATGVRLEPETRLVGFGAELSTADRGFVTQTLDTRPGRRRGAGDGEVDPRIQARRDLVAHERQTAAAAPPARASARAWPASSAVRVGGRPTARCCAVHKVVAVGTPHVPARARHRGGGHPRRPAPARRRRGRRPGEAARRCRGWPTPRSTWRGRERPDRAGDRAHAGGGGRGRAEPVGRWSTPRAARVARVAAVRSTMPVVVAASPPWRRARRSVPARRPRRCR